VRTVGIEIEYHGDNQAVIAAIREAGLSRRSSLHSYFGSSQDEWIVKPDGSVSNGGELVSPPLDFDDPAQREQINTAVRALRSVGCYPSDQTGIHVHVGCLDFGPKELVAVVKNFYKYEDIIYRLASSGWRTVRSGATRYAPPLSEARARTIASAKTLPKIMEAWYGGPGRDYSSSHGHGSRYCGLNLHSWFYRQTVEFRVFNGSMNEERVQAYVAMCVALIQDARIGNSRSINAAYRLGSMRDGSLNEKNAWHRFLQVLRYEAGMSKEDMALLQACWKDSRPQARFSNGV
jgi:hypothetical protein